MALVSMKMSNVKPILPSGGQHYVHYQCNAVVKCKFHILLLLSKSEAVTLIVTGRGEARTVKIATGNTGR
jgi:hypothetical protein